MVTFSEVKNEALCQPQLHVPGGGEPCCQVSPDPPSHSDSSVITLVRYQAAHKAGFSAVEVAHPYNEDMGALVGVLKETGLKQVFKPFTKSL